MKSANRSTSRVAKQGWRWERKREERESLPMVLLLSSVNMSLGPTEVYTGTRKAWNMVQIGPLVLEFRLESTSNITRRVDQLWKWFTLAVWVSSFHFVFGLQKLLRCQCTIHALAHIKVVDDRGLQEDFWKRGTENVNNEFSVCTYNLCYSVTP